MQQQQLSPTGSSTSSSSSSFIPTDGPFLPPLPVRGLRNLGNTCYLNAVLQNVLATSGLRSHFSGDQPDPMEGAITKAMRAFINQLNASPPPQLQLTAADAKEAALPPSDVLSAVSERHGRYARRAEQDSHEVLRQLLEGIRSEEVTRIQQVSKESSSSSAPASTDGKSTPPPQDPPTIVDDLFSGELRSTVVCLSCGSVSCSYEPFLDLSLPIPNHCGTCAPGSKGAAPAAEANFEGAGEKATRTLWEVLAKLPIEQRSAHANLQLGACLQAFAAPESLVGADAYACEKCAKEKGGDAAVKAAKAAKAAKGKGKGKGGDAAAVPGQPALKWLQVCRKPSVLTLHLKRFKTDGPGMGNGGEHSSKLDSHVPFSMELDLAPFSSASGKLDEKITHFSQLPKNVSDDGFGYRLYGVVEHQGDTTKGGHYVAFVRSDEHNCWHRFNDSVVTRVDEESVLKAQAFLLFYERFSSA